MAVNSNRLASADGTGYELQHRNGCEPPWLNSCSDGCELTWLHQCVVDCKLPRTFIVKIVGNKMMYGYYDKKVCCSTQIGAQIYKDM
jgi:hypothetical protein